MNKWKWKKQKAQSTNHPVQGHINDVRQYRIFEFGGIEYCAYRTDDEGTNKFGYELKCSFEKTSKSISRRAISSSRISSRIGSLP